MMLEGQVARFDATARGQRQDLGAEPEADISQLIVQANAFAEGDPNAALMGAPAATAEEPPEEEAPLEMDPVLYDIFSKETAGHVGERAGERRGSRVVGLGREGHVLGDGELLVEPEALGDVAQPTAGLQRRGAAEQVRVAVVRA